MVVALLLFMLLLLLLLFLEGTLSIDWRDWKWSKTIPVVVES